MAAALVPLQNITLGSNQTSIVFGSLPSTYKDLRIVVQGQLTASSNYFKLNFNGDSGNNYNYVFMRGNGSATLSTAVSNDASIYQTPSSISADTNTMITADVMDYSATDKHKSTLTRSHTDGVYVWAIAGRWANTSAITSVTIAAFSGSLKAGSTFALYGVVA